jgi:hypothetical protein
MSCRALVRSAVASPLVLALAATGCGDDGGASGPLDPDSAPVLAVDRFSDAAGTRLRRSLEASLPGPDVPIDLDRAPFTVHALGPAGEPVTYYDLDDKARALVPVYRLRRAGENGGVPGQLNLFDYAPGDHGYNDLWRLIDVEVPADYVANRITSTAGLFARGYPLTPTTTIINCAMVPAGSVARHQLGPGDGSLHRGWYHDQVVYYFTFEEAALASGPDGAPTAPIYVAYAIDPGAPGGGAPSGFRTEPGGDRTHNVVDSLPGDPGYTPLRALHVYETAAFDRVIDLATATAAPAVADDEHLANLPIVERP